MRTSRISAEGGTFEG